MLLTILSCTSTSPGPAMRDTSMAVEQRSGYHLVWQQNAQVQRRVNERVAELLARPLSVEGAVWVGLLRNPGLQATYEEVSVAQADLVQAGLLKNPVLAGGIHFPLTQGAQSDLTIDVVQDFLEVFMIPARRKVATARLSAVKARVGSAIIDFARDVKKAFFAMQAAEQSLAMRKVVLEAADAVYELAERQHAAGNINDLELAQQQSLHEQVSLDALRAQGEVLEHREALNRTMGVWGAETRWTLAPKLPELPTLEVVFERIEEHALAQRLDFAAAKSETQSLGYALNLAKDFRFVGGANVGLTYERTFAGPTVMGPGAAIELPIFDQRQAVIARLEALFRQSRARAEQLRVSLLSEVRSARNRVVYARKTVERHAAKLVPAKVRVTQLSQEQYDAMLLGVFHLIVAKQNEVNAYREFIEALRDYWIARAELERAVGGRLILAVLPSDPTANTPHSMTR